MFSKKMVDRKTMECAQFISHMGIMHPEDRLPLTTSSEQGDSMNWRAFKVDQQPGDLMVTWPGVYHSGINIGWNVNEALAIGMKNWVNEGKRYHPCDCEGPENKMHLDFGVIEAQM